MKVMGHSLLSEATKTRPSSSTREVRGRIVPLASQRAARIAVLYAEHFVSNFPGAAQCDSNPSPSPLLKHYQTLHHVIRWNVSRRAIVSTETTKISCEEV